MHLTRRYSRRTGPVRRARRLAPFFVGGLIAAVLLLVLWTYRALRHEPEFYSALLEVAPSTRSAAGDAMERRVLQLHNDARREGRWEAEFTSAQINGWLADDLPEKFPHYLPENVSDPRVLISPESAQLACRYTGSPLASVVSLTVSLQLTDEPNEVAIRVHAICAGALKLPLLESTREQCLVAARRWGASLQWVEVDGQDVALLQLPLHNSANPAESMVLDELHLREGSICFAGRTETGAPAKSVALPPVVDHAGVNRNVQR